MRAKTWIEDSGWGSTAAGNEGDAFAVLAGATRVFGKGWTKAITSRLFGARGVRGAAGHAVIGFAVKAVQADAIAANEARTVIAIGRFGT